MVAEALSNFKRRIDEHLANGEEKAVAIVSVLKEDIKTSDPVRFDGNGYSEEWMKEAAKRNLDVESSCPVATRYQGRLIKNVEGLKRIFPAEKYEQLSSRNMKLIEEIAISTERIERLVEELTEARRVANIIESIHQRAIAYYDSVYYDTVCPKMEAIRKEIDYLEMIVDDNLWTLRKYRELLFIC